MVNKHFILLGLFIGGLVHAAPVYKPAKKLESRRKVASHTLEEIQNTNYQDTLRASACASELDKFMGSKLADKTWVPKTVEKPFERLKYGISHRNTKTRLSYKLYNDAQKTFFSVVDEKKQLETIYQFDKSNSCKIAKSQQTYKYDPIIPSAGFSDQDLFKLMSSNRAGLIYVWSPYMPLSLQAIKEIKAAAELRKLPVTLLVDVRAEKAEIDIQVDKKVVNTTEINKAAAKEFFIRDLGVHFPTLYFYKDGFLSNDDYLGFKKQDMYTRWIDYQLMKIDKDIK